MALSRRQFLSVAAAGAGAILVAPRIVFANVETDRRFVFVIQRGAADGLNIVVPYAGAYARCARSQSTRRSRRGSTARSHYIRRSCRPRSCTATGRRCSFTRLPRRIATARISTGRTCSRRAAARRTR